MTLFTLPLDVTEKVAETRAWARLIAQQTREHEAHLARLAATDAEFDAWGARIDELCDQWEKHCG